MTARMGVASMFLAVLAIVSGCAKQEDAPPADADADTVEATEVSTVEVTPKMAETLAKADALDGESDEVVTLCASCALGMDGSAEHALAIGDYTMHFCTDHCRESFVEGLPDSVLSMNVDEPKEHAAH